MGGYAFWYHQLPLYLSAQAHFVFFDAAQPAVGFFLDYLAILGLFVWLAHYGGKGLQALAPERGADVQALELAPVTVQPFHGRAPGRCAVHPDQVEAALGGAVLLCQVGQLPFEILPLQAAACGGGVLLQQHAGVLQQ